MCAKVYIESFIYDESKTLKFKCPDKIFDVESYTLKNIHVEEDSKIESYCPNN